MLRLLLSDGWRELEGNVARRSGTRSWNFTERNIVPYLQNIRDLNHNTFFSKVRFTQSYILKHHYLGWHSSGCGSSWHKLFWSQIRQKSKGIENVIELLKYFIFSRWAGVYLSQHPCSTTTVIRTVSGKSRIVLSGFLQQGLVYIFSELSWSSDAGTSVPGRNWRSATRTQLYPQISDKKHSGSQNSFIVPVENALNNEYIVKLRLNLNHKSPSQAEGKKYQVPINPESELNGG